MALPRLRRFEVYDLEEVSGLAHKRASLVTQVVRPSWKPFVWLFLVVYALVSEFYYLLVALASTLRLRTRQPCLVRFNWSPERLTSWCGSFGSVWMQRLVLTKELDLVHFKRGGLRSNASELWSASSLVWICTNRRKCRIYASFPVLVNGEEVSKLWLTKWVEKDKRRVMTKIVDGFLRKASVNYLAYVVRLLSICPSAVRHCTDWRKLREIWLFPLQTLCMWL